MFLSSFFDCLSISVIWCDQRPKQGGGFYSAGYLRQKEFVIEGERGKQRAGTSNLKTSPNREGQPPITCVSKKRRKEGKRGGGSMIMRDKCKKDGEEPRATSHPSFFQACRRQRPIVREKQEKG
jgi:hypothetical protein